MGVEVVEKHKKRTRLLAPAAQPVEKRAIDRCRVFAMLGVKPPLHGVRRETQKARIVSESILVDVPENPADQDRGAKKVELLEDIIFVMGKTARETGIVRTIQGIGDKSGGCITPRCDEFGQKRGIGS